MQIQIIRAKSGEPVMYKNVFHAAYVIVKKHGIRGAYQGLPATWLRNIPANSAFFGECLMALMRLLAWRGLSLTLRLCCVAVEKRVFLSSSMSCDCVTQSC